MVLDRTPHAKYFVNLTIFLLTAYGYINIIPTCSVDRLLRQYAASPYVDEGGPAGR